MKVKSTFQNLLLSVFLIALVVICLAMEVGCGGPGKAQKSQTYSTKQPTNWVSVDVSFKPSTDEETRDKALKAVEKMLMNSAAPLKQQYPNYDPTIRITKIHSEDPLHYRMSVVNRYAVPGSSPTVFIYANDTTPPPPTCLPCPSRCRVCDSMISYVGTQGIEKMVIAKE